MTKILIIIVVAFSIEAMGIITLKKGLNQISASFTERKATTPFLMNVLKMVGQWFTNRHILSGLVLETTFFIMLQYLLSQNDVSYVWPLTSVNFVMSTLAAQFILRERVDAVRWGGVALIMLGTACIFYSEQLKKQNARTVATQSQSVEK